MKRSFMMVDLLTKSEENQIDNRSKKPATQIEREETSDDWRTSRCPGKVAREDNPGFENSGTKDVQGRQNDVLQLMPSTSATGSLSIEIETKTENNDKDDEEDRSSDSPGEFLIHVFEECFRQFLKI